MFEKLIYPEYTGRVLTLISDENEEINCQVLVVFNLKEEDEQKYIALLQIVDNDVSNDLMIYRFFEEDGSPTLEPIKSDLEYTEVANFLGGYLDQLEANHDDGCGCSSHSHSHDDGCSGCGCGCH